MRTVKELSKMDGRVYVFVKDESIRKILQDAENEGFTFGDQVLPTDRKETADIYAINEGGTINFVGFAGHMAFHHADHVGSDVLIKVDYEKYRNGEDFLI